MDKLTTLKNAVDSINQNLQLVKPIGDGERKMTIAFVTFNGAGEVITSNTYGFSRAELSYVRDVLNKQLKKVINEEIPGQYD